MDNTFRQNRFEVDLYYVHKIFTSNRIFKSGESYVEADILYANSNYSMQNTNFSLNREIFIRNIIKDVFEKYSEYDDIRIYYKYHRDSIYINAKMDDREYEYFRIIYQSDHDDYIIEEKNLIGEENVYDIIKNLLKKVNAKVELILNSLKRYELSGVFNIVLPSCISGFFIHELIGHLLEDDFFYHPATIINENITCAKILNITDLKRFNNNEYKYDDNGNCCEDIQLINNGKVINCISEKSGNRRRQDFMFRSLTRMRTTYIHPFSNCDVEDYIKLLKDGVCIEKVYGGSVNPIDGNYTILGYGSKIKKGKKTNLISKLKIEGNIVEDLLKIMDIGNDLEYQGVECGKKNQYVRVGVFSPSMILENIRVTGEVYE